MNGKRPSHRILSGISDALSDFVMKAIHKDRNQTFANANEMLRELERLENSGATTFQGVPKPVPPMIKKPEPKRTFVESKKPEPKK